jgi:hypothetical protein
MADEYADDFTPETAPTAASPGGAAALKNIVVRPRASPGFGSPLADTRRSTSPRDPLAQTGVSIVSRGPEMGFSGRIQPHTYKYVLFRACACACNTRCWAGAGEAHGAPTPRGAARAYRGVFALLVAVRGGDGSAQRSLSSPVVLTTTAGARFRSFPMQEGGGSGGAGAGALRCA